MSESPNTLRVVLQILAVAVVAAGVGWFVGQRPISSLQGELVREVKKVKTMDAAHQAEIATLNRTAAIHGAALTLCSAVGELDAANFGAAQTKVDAAKASLTAVKGADGLVSQVAGMKIDVEAEAADQRAALLELSDAVAAGAK